MKYLLITLVVLSPIIAHGQAENKGNFYEKNMAASPLGTRQELPNKLSNHPTTQNPVIPDATVGFTEGRDGIPIAHVGLLVNAEQAESFVNEMISIASALNIAMGPVSIVGNPTVGSKRAASKLLALGTEQVKPSDSRFAGSSVSPTWVLGTTQGWVTLEGLRTARSYINKRGEFIEPAK